MYVKTITVILMAFSPLMVFAAVSISSHIVISELQTGSATSASHEFIELYNPTEAAVLMDGWVLEYKAASSADTATTWIKKALITGSISSHGYYLVAPKSYLGFADAELSVGLAGTGGNIRLKSADGTIVDQIGYGETANAPEFAAISAPGAGQSLERLPGWKVEDGGNDIDTDDNRSDFIIRNIPDPQSIVSVPEVPSRNMQSLPEELHGEPLSNETLGPKVYPVVVITELLVDPQSPLNDSEDEFIELHNPSNEPAIITGYTLRAGTGFRDYYTLPETTIDAGGYVALFARDTGLSLVNTGGSVQIFNPAGTLIDQAETYPKAEPGLSWALHDGSWEWTLQSTPGIANVYVAPLVSAGSVKGAATKKASQKAVKAPKKASAKKVAAVKKPKAAKVKAAVTSKPSAPLAKNFQPANWLIALLIGLTITYAIYEFRYDIQNLYRRARGNR